MIYDYGPGSAWLCPPSLIHSICLIRNSDTTGATTEHLSAEPQLINIGIQTYSLPLDTPSRINLYQLGNVHFTIPQDVTDILTKHDGDVTQID